MPSPIMRTPANKSANTPQVRKTVRKTVRPLPSESKYIDFPISSARVKYPTLPSGRINHFLELNQSTTEKLVDWVVGSSAEQTYALICKNCKHHNGLAIKEEFEYMEWRCAFCHFLNVARFVEFLIALI